MSAGAVVGSQLPTVAHAAPEGGLQGAELRGMYLTTKDPLAEGRFGAMFKKLPAFAPSDDLLTSLAQPGEVTCGGSVSPSCSLALCSPRYLRRLRKR